jgi:hypothetical protein
MDNKKQRGRPSKKIPQDDRHDDYRNDSRDQPRDDDMNIIMQQIHDAELAMALEKSSNDDDLRRAQEEADAELARQLMAEDNPVPAGADAGDDMDQVLEQIAKMEAQERLQREGNAYREPLTLNNVLATEDAEERRIREKIEKEAKRQAELQEWRAERDRQDAEYRAAELLDKMKAQADTQISNSIPSATPMDASSTEMVIVDDDAISIPKSKEELRLARLAFFSNKKPSTQ